VDWLFRQLERERSDVGNKLERHTHARRDRRGKYENSPRCDCCGKPVGTAYYTDDDVCGSTDGPGFYICDRKRCADKRAEMSVDERRTLYTSQRKANEVAT